MAVKYQDYYETLGVQRDVSQEAIRAAYRKLARKYHPDVNKTAEAEERFKRVGEAYEVLSDPDKRKRYDALGADWKAGQEFTPPPGWEQYFGGSARRQTGGNGGFRFDVFGDFGESPFGGFSDFFETLFGGAGFGTRGAGRRRSRREPEFAEGGGLDQEAEITISLEEAYRGCTKTLTLESVSPAEGSRRESRTLELRIPPGTNDGQKLRLRGQGARYGGSASAGDLYLRVNIAPHPLFRLQEADLEIEAPVTPWEAALGARIEVPLLEGKASLRLQPGTQSGQRLRLRGKGYPRRGGGQGDLYVRVRIEVPKDLSARERELFEALARASTFRPRRW
jgi:curved DNA-binding protein